MVYFDTVVIGLGVTGTAALRSLAARNRHVLGIDRYPPGHDHGSSHGETRVIRLGYFEHPSYVPLVREALTLWRALEAESGAALLTTTGIVEFGAPDCELVRGTRQSSDLHKLPHEIMSAAEITARFPAFEIPAGFIGVFQPDAGYLAAEAAVAAHVASAVKAGAEIKVGCTVRKIESGPRGVRLTTTDGAIDAGRVIVAAGPWLPALLPEMPVRVTRQVMGWFTPEDPARFRARNFPVFLAQTRHGIHYGFPLHGSGVKIARHFHLDETVTPLTVGRAVTPHDTRAIGDFAMDHLPGLKPEPVAAKTCLYTMTPDGDFILDRLPGEPNVIVASPCSGHGFKFAPVIGEILADLATAATTHRNISRFRLSRFG